MEIVIKAGSLTPCGRLPQMWRHCYENTEGATEVNIAGEEACRKYGLPLKRKKPWKTV